MLHRLHTLYVFLFNRSEWSSFQFSLNKKCFSGGYRRWVIKILGEKCQNLQDIIREESDLVEKIAEVYSPK